MSVTNGSTSMSIPWAVVESVHDAADLLKCESPEIGALGQILTDEPVGVLVGTTLPGAIRVGEIEVGLEIGSELTVGGELSTVIGGDRFDAIDNRR